MTLKKYNKIRLVTTIIVAAAVSQFIVFRNIFAAVAIVAVASWFLFYLRSKVKVTEVLADERDYQIAGQAALLAMKIFPWMAVVAMFAFYFWNDPTYDLIAETLAFSVCGLMFIYSIAFRIKIKSGDEK